MFKNVSSETFLTRLLNNAPALLIGTSGLFLLSYITGHMEQSILKLFVGIGWGVFYLLLLGVAFPGRLTLQAIFGLLLGQILAIIITMTGGNIESLFTLKSEKHVLVENVDKWLDADIVRFDNGKLAQNYQYSETKTGQKVSLHQTPLKYYYKITPIVPENWTTADPVRLWACNEISFRGESDVSKFPEGEWLRSRSGIDVTSYLKSKSNNFPSMADRCAKRYGLIPSPYAKFIFVSSSPARALMLWGIIELVVIALFPIGIMVLSFYKFDNKS